jgi:TolB-like protein/tRNA A-37 threonylcarbamoyl transferase component Bud32
MAVEGLRQALSERYTIERELGRGGMATVYLATDAKVGRQVAIKVLHPELAAALGGERFHREIRIATHLTHPNILPVYDSGEGDGTLYYVMPFVEGESLRARLDRERQLGIDEAIRITCQIASALEYAHRANIVHRDIKPENILIAAGQAVLADFGIARAVTSAADAETLTRTGMSLGTPAYMSPEQAMGERNLDGRSDQYALACVTYEMLAGQPPFTAPTMQAVIARHIAEQVPLITTVRASVPEEVQEVILKALEKVPADRFATMKEFADALADAASMTMSATGRRAMPPRWMRQTTRTNRIAARRRPGWSRRRQLVAAVAGVAALASSAVAGVWAWDRPTRTASTGEVDALDPRRIAVLYFEERERDGELAFLADGLTASLIEELAGVSSLDVVSANGVAPYRGSDVSVDSIARALRVGSVVQGSVERARDRIRITVRLVDGSAGVDFRRGSFELPAAKLLDIRDSLAREVARFLRERLGEEVQLRELRRGTRDAQAWALVQRAERARKGADSAEVAGDAAGATRRLDAADSLLVRAEQLDPAWGAPIVSRSAIAYRRVRLAASEPSRAAPFITTGLAHAERALRLNARDAAALEIRGALHFARWALQLVRDQTEGDRVLADAERDLRAAVTIDPSRATAWNRLSQLYFQKPDAVEAKLAARRAYEEDAYLANAADIIEQLFTASLELEQFGDAEGWCRVGQRRFPADPRFVRCRLWLLVTRAKPPNPAEAWRLVDTLRSVTPALAWSQEGPVARMIAAGVLARAGMADSARAVVSSARSGSESDPTHYLAVVEAFVQVLLKNHDEAIRLLKVHLTANPGHRMGDMGWWWRDLQDDPRFQELIASAKRTR